MTFRGCEDGCTFFLGDKPFYLDAFRFLNVDVLADGVRLDAVMSANGVAFRVSDDTWFAFYFLGEELVEGHASDETDPRGAWFVPVGELELFCLCSDLVFGEIMKREETVGEVLLRELRKEICLVFYLVLWFEEFSVFCLCVMACGDIRAVLFV